MILTMTAKSKGQHARAGVTGVAMTAVFQSMYPTTTPSRPPHSAELAFGRDRTHSLLATTRRVCVGTSLDARAPLLPLLTMRVLVVLLLTPFTTDARSFTYRCPAFTVPSGAFRRHQHLKENGNVRSSGDLRLDLFNDPGKHDSSSNSNSDNNEGDESEPDWVGALLRWNQQPDKEAAATTKDPDTGAKANDSAESFASGTSKPNKAPIPLAALVNVEALLLASGADTGSSLDEVGPTDMVGLLSNFGVLDKARIRNSTTNNTDDSITSTASGSLTTISESKGTTDDALPNPLAILPRLEEQGDWNKLLSSLQQSVIQRSGSDGEAFASAAESILKEATSRMELFLNETANVVPPGTVEHVIMRASQALNLDERGLGLRAAADGIVKAAEDLAREQGLNVTEAADRARATTQYTAQLVETANGLLVAGYVRGEDEKPPGATASLEDVQMGILPTADRSAAYSSSASSMNPLFHRFETAKPVHKDDYEHAIKKSAAMASLSGAIYQDTIERCHDIGHSLVANGTSADVAWMVTDSVGYEDDYREAAIPNKAAAEVSREPVLVRTITIRGYDASDENVDRELLLYRICEGEKAPLGKSGVFVHKGLLEIADELYSDVTTYIDLAAPTHKLVFNGHSVGGSLSVLLLMLLVDRRGVDFVLNNFLRVYTFGSPPISTAPRKTRGRSKRVKGSDMTCSTLQAFGLPSDFVYQYVQPWDPIVRLFSEIDPCYPLLEDIGEDGITLYASGPSRALRPITRAIIESWEGWPRFRDGLREQSNQGYTGVGVQHLLLPEPTRYLTDRLVSVNIAIPPVYSVVQLSSRELMPALKETFPLDEFSISFVPAALRSFVHHFYPAYTTPFVDYANDKKRLSSEIEASAESPPPTRVDGVLKMGNMFSWPIFGGRTVTSE